MKIARGTVARGIWVGVAVAAMTGSAAAQQLARGGRAGQDRLRATYGNGNSLYVQVVPDGRPALSFESESSVAWVFGGDTASLVGKSYTIRLENRGRSRIKVVVGVDGVNAYLRKPLVGSADRDTGSILGPGQTRVLTGFQVDDQTAQRFVFSPQEFSEGAPVRGARVGEIEVHVYEEYRPDWERGRNSATPGAEGAVPNSRPNAAPSIGTTAGDDVDSEVRRVSFTASTREPIARLELAYGRPVPEREVPREDDRSLGRLGIAVEQHPDGLRIVRVDRDALADELGLREGDVITKVDTYARPTAAVLRRVLRDKGRADYLFLEVLRGRHVVNFKTRL